MEHIVYIRMKKNTEAKRFQQITLNNIAYITTSSSKEERLKQTPIYRMTKQDNNIVVIDGFTVVKHLNDMFKDFEFQLIGPAHTVVRLKDSKKKAPILFVIFVWVLLFIGTAMTIMNFHYDVSMQEVHQRLHYLLTNEENLYPLWIQIPYSLGLGIGMLLFFNHWFKKRFNDEPSPLEVEIFKYQEDIDQYVGYYENDLNDKNNND